MVLFSALLFGLILNAPYALWKQQVQLAAVLRGKGEYAKSEVVYRTALETAGRLPQAEVYKAITLNDLANLDQETGKLADAENLYLRSMAILEAAKPNSRILMRAAANFASVYIETGQTTKAEHLLLRFIPLDGSFPQGPDGPVLVSDLASIRVRQGRFAEAEILFRRVIAQLSAGAPGEHREELATAMTDLSEVFQKTGRLPEALDWAGRSRRLVETMPNPMPMLVIKTLNNLAEISAQSGKPADAAPLYRQAIEYAERTLGPQHPVLGDILLNYANFLRQRKNGREARKVEKRANAIRERTRHDNLEGYTVEASSLVNPSQNGKVGAMALKP